MSLLLDGVEVVAATLPRAPQVPRYGARVIEPAGDPEKRYRERRLAALIAAFPPEPACSPPIPSSPSSLPVETSTARDTP